MDFFDAFVAPQFALPFGIVERVSLSVMLASAEVFFDDLFEEV